MNITIESFKDKVPTIQFLRKAGWKVRVMHKREIDKRGNFKRGGETKIEITSPDGNLDAFGCSYCANEDNYNRKLGNKIALGRAWKNALALMEAW